MPRIVPVPAAALIPLAVTACDGDGGAAHRPVTSASAPAGCGTDAALKVTEHGCSKLPDTADGHLKAVSYAALVAPAGHLPAAVNAAVKVTFLDGSGRALPVNGDAANGTGTPFTLGAVAPGARRTVSGQRLLGRWPATMKVETTTTCAGDTATADIGVSGADLARHGNALTADLELTSARHGTSPGFPVFAFRDCGHRIVGGAAPSAVSAANPRPCWCRTARACTPHRRRRRFPSTGRGPRCRHRVRPTDLIARRKAG